MFPILIIADSLRFDGLSERLAVLGSRIICGIDNADDLWAWGIVRTMGEYFQLLEAGAIQE